MCYFSIKNLYMYVQDKCTIFLKACPSVGRSVYIFHAIFGALAYFPSSFPTRKFQCIWNSSCLKWRKWTTRNSISQISELILTLHVFILSQSYDFSYASFANFHHAYLKTQFFWSLGVVVVDMHLAVERKRSLYLDWNLKRNTVKTSKTFSTIWLWILLRIIIWKSEKNICICKWKVNVKREKYTHTNTDDHHRFIFFEQQDHDGEPQVADALVAAGVGRGWRRCWGSTKEQNSQEQWIIYFRSSLIVANSTPPSSLAFLLEVKLPYDPVCPSVGCLTWNFPMTLSVHPSSVGWLVCLS